jgi:Flp pilus assembly pilin Flp
MKRFFLFLGIFSLIVLGTQVFVGATEITFSIPPGWTPAASQNPEEKIHALLLDEQGATRAELIFTLEPVASNLDLQGYFQQVTQFLQGAFQSYTPQETTPFAVHGLSGLRHRFLFRVQQNPNELQGLAFVFLHENQVYTLFFDCLATDFPQLENQFQQIAQGLTLVESVTTATPYVTTPTPVAELPGIGTEAPPFWVHQNPQNTFKISLPGGASLAQELDNGAVYTAPNQSQIVILALESESYVQGIVAQAVQGKNFHGASQLNTATGNVIQVALYSSRNPDTGVEYATLVGTFPGKSLLVLVVLPAGEYEQAKEWIGNLFTQTEIR